MSVNSYLNKILNEEVSDFNKKLNHLKDKMIDDVKDHYKKLNDKEPGEYHLGHINVKIKKGKENTIIKREGSGREGNGNSAEMMINNETGNIYRVSGSLAHHGGHDETIFATLDTIDEYYWGGYFPTKIKK